MPYKKSMSNKGLPNLTFSYFMASLKLEISISDKINENKVDGKKKNKSRKRKAEIKDKKL